MFPLNKTTFRKNTIENRVKYIPQRDEAQSISRDIKPNTIKNNSLRKKQKNFTNQ